MLYLIYSLFIFCVVKTQPLKTDMVKWKSETPITMGQLNSKRDEFWETAPMVEENKYKINIHCLYGVK